MLLALLGCPHSPLSPASPTERFAAAVADAEEALPDEVTTALVPIRSDNAALVWEDGAPDPRLLVVTWTSWTGYDGSEGQERTLEREVWVTAAPSLRETCSAWSLDGPALAGRLEELLGLPPASHKDRMVELWVHPEDLFRPCPDNEIDDTSCSLEPSGDKAHSTWFEELRARSYGEGGYPWTRLGYTYDWGGDPESDVGLSELVIRAGSAVTTERVVPFAQYCAE